MGDTGPVLSAGDMTRRGLQGRKKKVVLNIRAGGILNLKEIAAQEPQVQEVRLHGGVGRSRSKPTDFGNCPQGEPSASQPTITLV